MNKFGALAFIIGFWLLLPIPFMYLNIGGYSTLNFDKLAEIESPQEVSWVESVGTFFSTAITLIGIYFQTMLLWINGVPMIINIFLWFLRIISGLSLLLILTGG